MISLRPVLTSALLLVATSAQAAWVSGGGKIRKDEQNPWWFYNTVNVTFCIDVDPAAFTLSEADAARNVYDAFDYWKTELGNAEQPSEQWPEFPLVLRQLGTQQFERMRCNGQEDVHFYFGKATPELVTYLSNLGQTPSDYIGLAIRTSYDEVNLRGKGFVYISPDKPESPHYPNLKDMKPEVWSIYDQANFQAALQHEIGHLFGLPHEHNLHDRMGYLNLMAEDFPAHAAEGDDTVARRQFQRLIKWSDERSGYSSCWDRDRHLDELLGIPAAVECLKVDAKLSRLIGVKANGGQVDIAQFERPFGQWGDSIWQTRLINAWLPAGQQVFRSTDGELPSNERIYLNSTQVEGNFVATLKPNAHPDRSILMHADLTTECLVIKIATGGGPLWYPMAITPHEGKPIGNCGKG